MSISECQDIGITLSTTIKYREINIEMSMLNSHWRIWYRYRIQYHNVNMSISDYQSQYRVVNISRYVNTKCNNGQIISLSISIAQYHHDNMLSYKQNYPDILKYHASHISINLLISYQNVSYRWHFHVISKSA